MTKDIFGLAGKKVLISGAFSGMGYAACELLCDLGAEVYAVCRKNGRHSEMPLPVKGIFEADFGVKEDLDRLADEIPEGLEAIFLCHGIAAKNDGSNRLMVNKVNFLGHKYFLEKAVPKVVDGGSVTIISSTGGYGWEKNLENTLPFVQVETYEDALKLYEEKADVTGQAYVFSKQCLNTYTQYMCHEPLYIDRKIRLNTICPGNTLTGLTDEFNRETTPTGDAEAGKMMIESIFLDSWNGHWATSEEMGYPMVAIGSRIFSYMSGQVIYFDYGLSSEWNMEEYK